MLVYQWLSANDTVGLAVGSCRIPKKRTVQTTVLFLCHSVVFYLPGPVLPCRVGRRHCAVERVLWTMQRNGATQAQGVEGRCPCANAQRPCAQSRDRFLTFYTLNLYGWPATGQKLSARCAGCSETAQYPAATYLSISSHEKLFHNFIQLRRYFCEAAIQVKRFCAY